MKGFALIALVSQLFAVVLLSSSQTEAAGGYLVNLVKNQIISRSLMATELNATLERVKERYEEAKKLGNFNPDDETEASNAYYRIVIDETKKLKEKIKADKSGKIASAMVGQSEKVYVPPNMYFDDMDESDDAELSNELDELNELVNEPVMGFSLTEENKEILRLRTKEVLAELMSEELRSLAIAIATSYLTGGAVAGTAVLINEVKYKLLKFLMNCVMDLLASIMGRPIEVGPVNQRPLI